MKWILVILLILIIALSTFYILFSNVLNNDERSLPFYTGIAFQGDTVSEAKLLIDRVKNYTNVFLLGTTPVSRNETATNEVCDYAVAQGLNIIVNFGYYDPNPVSPDQQFRRWPWQHEWLMIAQQKYGDRLLGVYYDDEPAGMQIDYDWSGFFQNYSSYLSQPANTTLHKIYVKVMEHKATNSTPDNYDLEATFFVESLKRGVSHDAELEPTLDLMTSDYALYWFDYKGGYDLVFGELGLNQSHIKDIALIRGAAFNQNKSWGTIVTWKYDAPPYLPSGDEMYLEMVDAYRAGAKYVLIFNYPKIEGNNYGVMTDDHFSVLERFWNEIQTGKLKPDSNKASVALVFPRNYGWGMRKPDDRIWGMWGPDSKSSQIWNITHSLLLEYGLKLDIVYDDPSFSVTEKYDKIYNWNQTR